MRPGVSLTATLGTVLISSNFYLNHSKLPTWRLWDFQNPSHQNVRLSDSIQHLIYLLWPFSILTHNSCKILSRLNFQVAPLLFDLNYEPKPAVQVLQADFVVSFCFLWTSSDFDWSFRNSWQCSKLLNWLSRSILITNEPDTAFFWNSNLSVNFFNLLAKFSARNPAQYFEKYLSQQNQDNFSLSFCAGVCYGPIWISAYFISKFTEFCSQICGLVLPTAAQRHSRKFNNRSDWSICRLCACC